MADIGFDGIVGGYAAIALLVAAALWLVVAVALRRRGARGVTPFAGGCVLVATGGVVLVALALGARRRADRIGEVGAVVGPLVAVVATLVLAHRRD